MKSNDSIERLLPDYFSGKLSVEEGKIVDEWVCESAEHRRTAEEYCRLEYLLANMEAPDSNETEAALRNVHSRMRCSSRRSFMSNVQRIAAIMALPLFLMACWFAWQYYRDDKPTEVTVNSVAGMTAAATLPDGSQVWLNSNSTLHYPVRFGDTREVQLEGEAYFKVARQESRPFIVHAKDATVEVLGTEFDVEAYPGDTQVRTSLINGSVRLSLPAKGGLNTSVTMRPGDCYAWNLSTGKLSHNRINLNTAASWKDGKIVLENTSLEEALRQIGNRFNVEFLVRNDELLTQRYTGTFTGQRLEVVLEHFRRTTRIHFDYDIKGADSQNITGRQKILVY
ncbi:MAG: FecR domain-containing protein [Bacteroidales bacterium]|nr:FecR domain-containing protein [Bacteroidales bacterium]